MGAIDLKWRRKEPLLPSNYLILLVGELAWTTTGNWHIQILTLEKMTTSPPPSFFQFKHIQTKIMTTSLFLHLVESILLKFSCLFMAVVPRLHMSCLESWKPCRKEEKNWAIRPSNRRFLPWGFIFIYFLCVGLTYEWSRTFIMKGRTHGGVYHKLSCMLKIRVF